MGVSNFYSEKMWYLARMPHSSKGHAAIAVEVERLCAPAGGRKVLVLDLDNTLWGGVVGDLGPGGVELSDERRGLVFKDVQREVKRMQRAGVVLAVVSKNNPGDALAAFRENGHMALSESDVSAMRLNWERKDTNLLDIASALNLGTDSFVFLDDSPAERELVERTLPEVEILDFPADVSGAPALLRREYRRLFQRVALTEEDRMRGERYAANARRAELEGGAVSFEEYLAGLDIRMRSVDPGEHLARIAQLIVKTNQFNLTTIRYTQEEVAAMVASDGYRFYAYEVLDRFGDNGITAIAIVDLAAVPRIDTLILSCRVMGRRIEDFVVTAVEDDLATMGFAELLAEYRPTKKNMPAAGLYDRLGYERTGVGVDGAVSYRIALEGRPNRVLYAKGE